MDYKINKTYELTQTCEFSVDWNGFNFLIIYGKHINGWFIAITNWNVCVEAVEPSDECYNATKLARANFHDEAPSYLARAIREHWEKLQNG